ncbi:MAG: ABC transporter permease [Actinomycetota bacterium]|nr:ABC transporter permease [Actinomycetota bacterium]
MNEAIAHSYHMVGRQARNLFREPIWIAMMLVQPMIWLLLYSQLFRRVVELPGFETRSFLDFFAPAVVVMTAFFQGTWSGMGMITDLDRGVIERFLATPARRSAIVLSQVLRSGTTAAIQGAVILVVCLPLGTTNGGPVGWALIVAAGMLVSAGFSGISQAVALLTRREATMIAVANFIGLPLMFFSAMLIDFDLIPGWMQWVARVNPVQWAVDAAREPVLPDPDWGLVGISLAGLTAFTAATAALATRTFRAYQRTL